MYLRHLKTKINQPSQHLAFLLIGFPFCLLLSACSSGPTPKAAKEICTGTKRPYEINGKTYVPQDHYDYDEEGDASWYGPGFHKRPGSCGSIYDQYSYTAAHKTLPIPSVVEVTNVENGRKIKLVINDRGPFVDGRIIDLSQTAAEHLGTHRRGIGKVRVRTIPSESHALANYLKQFGRWGIDPSGRPWDVIYREEIAGKHHDIKEETPEELLHHVQEEAIETILHPEKPEPKIDHLSYRPGESKAPKEKKKDTPHFDDLLEDLSEQAPAPATSKKGNSSTPKKNSGSSGSYFVQVGSFVQKSNAHTLTKDLTKHGRAQVVMEDKNFYTVQLGPFTSQSQANKVVSAVSKEGHHGARLTQ